MAFTYFFRDLQSLNAVAKYVLPEVRGSRYINIWDAGCAHGPEPYSLAVTLSEQMSHFLFRNLRIYATDIDVSGTFGKTISDGIYPYDQIKRIPADIRKKYFTLDTPPGLYRIDDQLRSHITFVKHDLLSLTPVRYGFSLIVCKNVLLHLKPDQRQQVIEMFYSTLRDPGFLLIEQTQQMPQECEGLFAPVTSGVQLFRKVDTPVSSQNDTTHTPKELINQSS